jgi:hypothetical protein
MSYVFSPESYTLPALQVKSTKVALENIGSASVCIQSALQWLSQRRILSAEEYEIACDYIDIYNAALRFSGAPAGFNTSTYTFASGKHSSGSWIQNQFARQACQYSFLDTAHTLLQKLQHTMTKQNPDLLPHFNKLLFEDWPPQFGKNIRLYVKAFKMMMPRVIDFMSLIKNLRNAQISSFY